MLLMVDNSQGHAAYSADALLVSKMNMKPGGKQARMRDGWYYDHAGNKIMQPMVYPPDHPIFPDQPKGLKAVLEERGLFQPRMSLDCSKAKKTCLTDNTCYARRVMGAQEDFKSQRSLVQEVVEEAGHMCIFLPKYHCELNFIEYFWAAVKRDLREHCDYTFEGLNSRMESALASVTVETIRKWEHRMWRWIEAYSEGLSCKDAQMKVRQYSSTRYKSHRRVPEGLSQILDE